MLNQENFLALGRSGKSAWWRYLCGIVSIRCAQLMVVLIVTVILARVHGGHLPAFDRAIGQFIGIDQLASFVIINTEPIGALVAIWLVIRYVHERSLLSLITPSKRLNLKRVLIGFAIWFALSGLGLLIGSMAFPGTLHFCFNLSEFLRFLPAVLILTPVQSLTEEVFFRGYLLQGLASLIRNQWVLAALNGLLFALPHLRNPGVSENYFALSIYFFGVGFLLAQITITTNSAEVAVGQHIANNLFCALVANHPESILHTAPVFLCDRVPIYDLASFVVEATLFYFLAVKLVRRVPDRPATVESV